MLRKEKAILLRLDVCTPTQILVYFCVGGRYYYGNLYVYEEVDKQDAGALVLRFLLGMNNALVEFREYADADEDVVFLRGEECKHCRVYSVKEAF